MTLEDGIIVLEHSETYAQRWRALKVTLVGLLR